MTVTLTYDDTLSRVNIVADALAAADTALIERSTDQVLWTTVRGGDAVPVTSYAQATDDYGRTVAAGSWGTATTGQIWSVMFGGAGQFTGVQRLAFVIVPVHLFLHGLPYKIAGGGDLGRTSVLKIDTIIRSIGTPYQDTLIYVPLVASVQGGLFDPFSLPLPAPWGRDGSHPTTWNIHVLDTTRVLVPKPDSVVDCWHL